MIRLSFANFKVINMALTFKRVSPIPNFTTICERQPLSKNWLDVTKKTFREIIRKA